MNNNTVNLPHLCQQVQNLVLQVAQFIREQEGQVRQTTQPFGELCG